MKKSSREINVFSVSALDLFASALGAFIVMSMIFMVFFTMTSQGASQAEDMQLALDRCENALTRAEASLAQCESRLGQSVDATALAQCQSDLAAAEARNADLQSDLAAAEARNADLQSDLAAAEARAASAGAAAEQLDAINADLESCRRALKKTFVLVLASWSTNEDDVDLHVVDPSGNEFYFSDRRHPGSDAVFEEDNTDGPGNEIWLHPNAEAGRYRVCYKLYSDHSGSPLPSVRGSVLWQEGKLEIPNVRLTAGSEVRLAVEFDVDDDGNVSLDRSRSGRRLGTGRCR